MDRQEDDKIRFHNFIHNLKYGLIIKRKASKIFTFLQAEFVSSQTSVHAVHCLVNLAEFGKFRVPEHNECQQF
jgi:hypothetical protein